MPTQPGTTAGDTRDDESVGDRIQHEQRHRINRGDRGEGRTCRADGGGEALLRPALD
jgi:hypothetical protein